MTDYINLLQKIGSDSKLTIQEKKDILELYYIMTKNEARLNDLVYNYHGCDSWEDIFRDYDSTLLEEKAEGIKIAIENINKYESND